MWVPIVQVPELCNGKVKFCNFGFSIAKSDSNEFFRNYSAYNLYVDRCRLVEDMCLFTSRSFLDHG